MDDDSKAPDAVPTPADSNEPVKAKDLVGLLSVNSTQNCDTTAVLPPKKVIGRPFQKGDAWTGNAGGRPKKRIITDEYHERLETPAPTAVIRQYNSTFPCPDCSKPGDKRGTGHITRNNGRVVKCRPCKQSGYEQVLREGATGAEVAAFVMMLEVATKRSVGALREMRESCEGSAPQRMEISTPADRAINIRVTYDSEPGKNAPKQVESEAPSEPMSEPEKKTDEVT